MLSCFWRKPAWKTFVPKNKVPVSIYVIVITLEAQQSSRRASKKPDSINVMKCVVC